MLSQDQPTFSTHPLYSLSRCLYLFVHLLKWLYVDLTPELWVYKDFEDDDDDNDDV